MSRNLLLRGYIMEQVIAQVMSFDATGILEKLKDVLLVGQVIDKVKGLWGLIPQSVFDFYKQFRNPVLIVAICLLVLIAFEGHKLFKMALHVAVPAGAAIVGHMFLAPFVAKYAAALPIPEFVEIPALVAIVCALIGLFISRCAYNLVIMVIGGVVGFDIGAIYVWRVIKNFFSSLEFLDTPMAKYIVGGVCASVCVLVFVLLFKHLFIIGSSFGCLAFAGLLLQKLAVPTADDMMKGCFILVGLAVAVFAVVHQYREEEKSYEILF
jgi:hypothetical protein